MRSCMRTYACRMSGSAGIDLHARVKSSVHVTLRMHHSPQERTHQGEYNTKLVLCIRACLYTYIHATVNRIYLRTCVVKSHVAGMFTGQTCVVVS